MQNARGSDQVSLIKHNTDADIDARQGTTFQYIGINLTHPILKNKKVRQAIACAIDRRPSFVILLKTWKSRQAVCFRR